MGHPLFLPRPVRSFSFLCLTQRAIGVLRLLKTCKGLYVKNGFIGKKSSRYSFKSSFNAFDRDPADKKIWCCKSWNFKYNIASVFIKRFYSVPRCMDAPNTPCPIPIILIMGYYKRHPNAKTCFHPPASPLPDTSIHAVYGQDRRPPFGPVYCIGYQLPNPLSWCIKCATYFTNRKRNLQHVFLYFKEVDLYTIL